MDALSLLLSRSSQPKLSAPAPEGEALETIKQAALRTPDHASLKPWRFIVCTGKGLHKLGDLLQESAILDDKDQASINRAIQLPLRAPMVIIAITEEVEHDKVPMVEQICSTACAVHAMQMAAVAQGFQGIWRTGSYAQSDNFKKLIGVKPSDEVVGFLYLGTSSLKAMPKPAVASADYFSHWE
jgi:nitroreductase